jgi:hypothetical protein
MRNLMFFKKKNTFKFVVLILNKNKHEKNYFNNGSNIRFRIC